MDNIFLAVIHLVKHETADDTAFAEILKHLKDDLLAFDKEGTPASITVIAETGIFSCEIAIGVSCEHEKQRVRLNKLADSYRGTFLLQDRRRA